MGLDRFNKTPCGFCFVEYYTHLDALDCLKYVGGTKLDERIIRTDLDPGFEEGRQYGYVEWHFSGQAYGIRGSLALTNTVEASLVARFGMNTVKNLILVVVVTVEPTLTTSADGRRKNMERVSNLGLELDLLAHIRSLYKGNFYNQKTEMKGRQTRKSLLNTPRPCEYCTDEFHI